MSLHYLVKLEMFTVRVLPFSVTVFQFVQVSDAYFVHLLLQQSHAL